MGHKLFSFYLLCAVYLFNLVPSLLATPIIGGIPDVNHRFKYAISIHIHKEHEYVICSGSIIGEKYVLTAAHCFMRVEKNVITSTTEPEKIKVFAGTNRIKEPGVKRKAVKVFIPNTFEATNERKFADIAVVQLNANLGVSANLKIMDILPIGGLAPKEDASKMGVFCGFGYYQIVMGYYQLWHPIGPFPDINNCLTVIMIGSAKCPEFESSICAIARTNPGVHTACMGDSGGTLTHQGRAVGVVSNGPHECNAALGPIVFTRLSTFRSFVDRAMNERADHSDMHVLGEKSMAHVASSSQPNRNSHSSNQTFSAKSGVHFYLLHGVFPHRSSRRKA